MNQVIQCWFEQCAEAVDQLAKDVFEHPEISAEEEYACRVTAQFMRQFGFDVETFQVPPAQVENGLRAVWGSGAPVIGILGEYDALPGLGQEAVPYRAPQTWCWSWLRSQLDECRLCLCRSGAERSNEGGGA